MMVSIAPVTVFAQAPIPGKSILRRGTLSGTIRKSDDAELDGMFSDPPSPSKRLKVSFKDEPVIERIENYGAKPRSLEAVRLEVKRAIEARKRGDNAIYDAIKEVFAPREDDNEEVAVPQEEMKAYVLALTSYVSLLNKGCTDLVRVLLACEWMGRDEGFVKAYVRLLGNLASAQGTFVGLILNMLVEQLLGVPRSSGNLLGYPAVNFEVLQSRVHMALKYLLQVIPSASATLSPILSTKFPFSEDSKKVHITYIDSLLCLIQYAPELKLEVFALITDRLVKIDVQMQDDLDDLDEEDSATILHPLPTKNASHEDTDGEDAEDESDADSVSSEESMDEDLKRAKDVRGNIEKMDAILERLFEAYNPYFSDPNSDEAISMFSTMLGHFTNIILPTYRSRHTQFLLFHFAQTSEMLVDNFAGTCVQLAFQPGRPAPFRQASAAYLASFVARGALVQPSVVREVFELIGTNLDHIRIENEVTCRGPSLQRYGTFYAMTQALLYIFCFRWRDLITNTSSDLDEDDDPAAFIGQDLSWTPGINETFTRAIYSSLNPLKVCSPPIVSEFAKIAHHLRFMYIYPLLETNKRIRLSQSSVGIANGALRDSGSAGSSESLHQLDAYFPFDPYQLPKSKKWVDKDYVHWQGIPGLNKDEEDEEDDESSNDEEDDEADLDGVNVTEDGGSD